MFYEIGSLAPRTTPNLEDQVICNQGFLPLAFERPTSYKAVVAGFGPPLVFYFPSTHHIWRAFPYPPPGEAPDGRPATPHGIVIAMMTLKHT
jgi:hypothetical protein